MSKPTLYLEQETGKFVCVGECVSMVYPSPTLLPTPIIVSVNVHLYLILPQSEEEEEMPPEAKLRMRNIGK